MWTYLSDPTKDLSFDWALAFQPLSFPVCLHSPAAGDGVTGGGPPLLLLLLLLLQMPIEAPKGWQSTRNNGLIPPTLAVAKSSFSFREVLVTSSRAACEEKML
jgi:hypothetical protein